MSKITKEQLQDSRNEFYDAIHDSIELLLIQVKKAETEPSIMMKEVQKEESRKTQQVEAPAV